MAEIYTASEPTRVPATPIKGATVSTSEVAPEYTSPAPQYNKDGEVFSTGFKPIHPLLPVGDIVNDIQNHLSCHKNFSSNVDVLMYHLAIMKKDLDEARSAQALAERDLVKEREEKEAAKREVEVYKRALKEAQTDLEAVRADLAATEQRLSLAVTQLRETAQRLEYTRNELRAMTKERDELLRTVAEVRRQLEFQMARAKELQAALDIANAGENAANDRNTRLTELLYQIEAQKASIERTKDAAEANSRRLELINEQLRQGADRPEMLAQIAAQAVKIEQLIIDIKKQDIQLKQAQDKATARGHTIEKLNGELHERRGEIKQLRKDKQRLRELIQEYKKAVNSIPPKYRGRFPKESHIISHFSYSTAMDQLCAVDDVDTEDEAEIATASVVPEVGESSKVEAQPTEEMLPTNETEDGTEPTNTDA